MAQLRTNQAGFEDPRTLTSIRVLLNEVLGTGQFRLSTGAVRNLRKIGGNRSAQDAERNSPPVPPSETCGTTTLASAVPLSGSHAYRLGKLSKGVDMHIRVRVTQEYELRFTGHGMNAVRELERLKLEEILIRDNLARTTVEYETLNGDFSYELAGPIVIL